ncbi:XrtA/PEP-CTERM system TPR-repeat protein PrsT [Thalassotalea ganghwensis]
MNKNKLACTILMLSMFGMVGCGPNKNTAELINLAKQQIESSELSSAIISLKNTVQLEPSHIEARELLGYAYLQQGSYQSAEKELSRAIELGSDNPQTVSRLAFAYMNLQDIVGLESLINQAIEIDKDNYALLILYTGLTYYTENELEKGQEYLHQVTSSSQNEEIISIGQAYLAFKDSQYEQSLNLLNKTYSSAELRHLKNLIIGHSYHALSDYDMAQQAYQKLSKTAVFDTRVILFRINSLINDNNLDVAEPIIDKLLVQNVNAPLLNQYKAQVEYSKGNYREALTYADKATTKTALMPMARMIAGVSAFQLDEIERAYSNLKSIEGFLSKEQPLGRILTLIKVKLGYMADEADNLALVENWSASDIDLLKQSTVELIKLEDFKKANEIISKALAASPSDPKLLAHQGMLLLKENDKTGIEYLEKVIALEPQNQQVIVATVLQFIAQGQTDKALVLADKLAKDELTQKHGLIIKGLVHNHQNDKSKAKTQFNKVLSLESNNFAALYYLGLIAHQEGELAQATDFLKKALNEQPSHTGALTQLIAIQSKAPNRYNITSFLESLYAKYNNNESILLTLSAVYLQSGETPKAIEVLNKQKGKSYLSDRYWLALATAYQQSDNISAAISVLEEASTTERTSDRLVFKLLDTYRLAAQYKEMEGFANLLLKQQPDNGNYQLALAKALVEQKNFEQANNIITSLSAKYPTSINVKRVLYRLAELEGNYQQAANTAKQIFAQTEGSNALLKYAYMLRMQGQQKKALTVLQEYSTKHPDNVAVKALISEYLLTDETEKALANYYLLLKKHPDNVVLLNNIAWGELHLGNADKALGYSRQAKELAPANVAVLDTFGEIHVALGNIEKAVEVFNQALQISPDNVEVMLSLANAHLLNNNKEKARELVAKLNNISPDLQEKYNKIKQRL